MDKIEQLCRRYTDLNDEEIGMIRGMAAALQPLANLEDADMFVNCITRDGEAIVVAEAKPQSGLSSYKNTVVGMIAKAENEPAVARTFDLGVATKQMKAVTQERCTVIQSVEPIKNGKRVVGVLIREKRVEEQHQRDERLHVNSDSYELIANAISHMTEESNWLTECIDEALLLVNGQGVVSFRNSLARELYLKLGYIDDVLGQPFENVRLMGTEMADNRFAAVETKVGQYYLVIKKIPLQLENAVFAVVVRDITRHRLQEKQLILKSVAIKEMHHRVKNNLQTIASLLRLQMRRSDHEETKQVLMESMNRILSIATTHELLSKGGVNQVNIGEVILNIKNNAVRYFARPYFEVDIALTGDDFLVDSDVSTSVSLISNELLQNSLKYAFEGMEKGEIQINVTKGDFYSVIRVSDNGCGFDVTKQDNSRLGLSIVKSLVKDKLGGSFILESDPEGTVAIFDFETK